MPDCERYFKARRFPVVSQADIIIHFAAIEHVSSNAIRHEPRSKFCAPKTGGKGQKSSPLSRDRQRRPRGKTLAAQTLPSSWEEQKREIGKPNPLVTIWLWLREGVALSAKSVSSPNIQEKMKMPFDGDGIFFAGCIFTRVIHRPQFRADSTRERRE